MGGGNSTPVDTRPMEWINEQTKLLPNYANNIFSYTDRIYYVNNGVLNDAAWGKQGWSTQSMLEYNFYYIINKVPINVFEAIAINKWKETLVNYLPYLVRYVNPTSPIKNLIDQLVELKFVLAAKENLDSDPNTQANVINYYHNTKLLFNPIDNKYVSMISGVGKNTLQSNYLFNTIYTFLYGKIIQQFTRDGLLRGNENDLKFFFNMCVKVIEDKPYNLYGDNETEIKTITKMSYDDADLATAGIFKDVESLKGSCKFLLFLYRKKNCSKYIMQNTKEVPNENDYRTCRIVGTIAINKPQKILEAEKESKEGFENNSQSESIPKVEKFEENNIFKKIETNLKLILGYTLIVIVICVLMYIAPSVFNSLYILVANYIIPSLLAILSVLGETVMVMTKLISTSMEALFGVIINLITLIYNFVMIFIKFGADGASGAVHYVIDQLSTVFKIITEGGQSILELIYNLFSSLAEKIFNYMKKYYMTINNIEAE